jgi:ketosteroid isomerase-like protein
VSRENVDLVRRGAELWLSGDLEGWLETLDPDIGWDISAHPLPDVPDHGQGRESFVTDMLGTYVSGWNEYVVEIEEATEVGDQVLLVLHETATMRQTGVRIERDLVQLWSVRNGLADYLRVFQTKDDALEAARSRENVDLVRDGFAALARGDYESFLGLLDEDVEWVNPPYAVEPGTRRGVAEFRAALEKLQASFGDIRPEVLELIDAGDAAVVVGRWRGEGTGSGVPMEATFASVVTVRHGRVARYQWFRDKAEALDAAGVTES